MTFELSSPYSPMKEHDFQKYLKKNPAPRLENPHNLTQFTVIPVYDENDYLPATLKSLAAAPGIEKTLVVLVINHPLGAPQARQAANEELLSQLKTNPFNLPHQALIAAPNLTGGVGQARKIGMDAVLATLNSANIDQAIIWSLDADSPVEPEYFDTVLATFNQHSNYAALSLQVHHQAGVTLEQERAIREYERYLRNYVRRLQQAGSPYAFMTIGSAFAVRSSAYIRAGGMRVRAGGEDFYFLQAVAKTGIVGTLDKVLVHPSARASDRVPFGTGPAVRNLLNGKPLEEIPDFPFEELKKLLNLAAQSGALNNPADFLDRLPVRTREFLVKEKFPDNWQRILANTPCNSQAQLAAFHRWFDGLKTLRFLHALTR